jgi:carboxyl-terminal processing protease
LLNRLKTVAAEVDVEWNEDEYLKSQNLIFVQLKALMARDLYDSSAFFRIINDENDIYLEGLKIISDEKLYNQLLQGV